MKKLIGAMLAGAGALCCAAPASAQAPVALAGGDCRLRIDTGASNWIIQGYDPFDSNPPVATFDLVFSNDGGSACVFDPVFATDSEPFGLKTEARPERVMYTLLDQFSNRSATPVSGRTIQSITNSPVTVTPGGQQLIRYQFVVNEDQLKGDGLYAQHLTVTAERRGRGDVLAARSLVLGINVLPSAVLGLSGAYRRNGGQALVDLGELAEGVAPVPLQIHVASTRAYNLNFVSKNRGQLKMPDTAWSVPYQLMVGEETLSLASSADYASSGTGPTNDSLPLRFSIGSVAGKRAGVYSDLITVAISPR